MVFNRVFFNKYSSWMELEAAIESIETSKEKGTAFEQFVFAYFTYFKDMYLISELYPADDIPLELKKEVKLEKRDSGVDGLIVKESGKIVAYQAKFRSGRLSPCYDELTSFWAESEHADERCIFANCYELPQQAYKKKDQFTILLNEINSLKPDFFEWLYTYVTTGITEMHVQKYTPMPHQVQMISDVLEGFATEKKGKMLAACGTGKTLTALWIKEGLSAKNVLFVAPNLALIKQTLEAWMPQAKAPFTYLCVCSDTTVAENTKHMENDDCRADAFYIGVPVTTDSKEILDFIEFESPKDKIIFSTYQSLDAIVGALKKTDGFTFDIAFFDEAHRTAGNKDSQMFIMGMNDAFIPSEKRLFMTATERFVNPRIVGRALEYNYEVFSMDNYEQYGPTFTALPFRSAIEQGIISDYKIVFCCMKEGELKRIIDHNLVLNIGDREMDSQNLFKQVLLSKVMNDIGIRKAVSYHRDIESAKRFISSSNGTSLNEVISGVSGDMVVSDVYCGHINGSMSSGARKAIFDEFISSPCGVISNARCLTEGVDIPVIDAVYFADPKNAVVDIIQAVGRSLRKVKDNPDKISYIIIPVIISDEISDFKDIDPENFSTLHTVVQALRDQDRILADYIDKLNLKLASGEKPKGLDNGDLPIVIEATEQLGIDDIAGEILLRVAEVNRDPAKVSRAFVFEAKPRTSGVRRGLFTTIGDYNLESYWKSCVIATLRKYESFDVGLPRDAVKISHNNISHSVKIGAIIQKERKFYVTDVGRKLFACASFAEAAPIFSEQLLKVHKLAPITRVPHFPYRFALKVFMQVEKISKLEFAYALFIAKNLEERGVSEACERILYLKDTYPRFESLSEANKEIVLAALNEKFDTTLKLVDLWSAGTTLSNQFNYLKKHLAIWPGVSVPEAADLTLAANGADVVSGLLEKTKEIETCPMDKLTAHFVHFNNWLRKDEK